jgi:A/G-specific adenine glycosylase
VDIERLKRWFLTYKRKLPWRESPTSYQVWISEVMLQQTQVSVVIEYYLRWMEAFPTVKDLAEASLEQVIKIWEGLGYYSRARRLHQAAQEIVKYYQGQLPDKEEELKRIPGLGPYTVNAILSFAFHKKAAAVDGNVVRVITRHEGLLLDGTQSKSLELLRLRVFELLPEKEPWVAMEALIEFGALVCKKKPECFRCPMRLSCRAYEDKNPEDYPLKKAKPPLTHLYHLVCLIEYEGYVLLYKEVDRRKRMADLWGFPFVQLQEARYEEKCPDELAGFFKSFPAFVEKLPMVKQSFTRYQAHLFPLRFKAGEAPVISGYYWVEKTKILDYPFSSGHKKLAATLACKDLI